MGVLGGLFSGGIAFYANIDAGYQAALVPGLKQFVYSLLVGGTLVRITERISISLDKKALSLFFAALVPATITTILITSIHLFKGTPNPLQTIIYTAAPTPFGFFIIAYFKRKRFDKKRQHVQRQTVV